MIPKDFVFSQTPTPAIPLSTVTGTLSLPGINCGDARDLKNNKCCYNPDQHQPLGTQIVDKTGGCLIDWNILGAHLQAICLKDLVKDIFDKIESAPGVKFLSDFRDIPQNPCVNGEPQVNGKKTTNYSDPNCICVDANQVSGKLCRDYLSTSKELAECNKCFNKSGVWTGMGCIYTDIDLLIKENLLKFGIGLAGIIALLCIIYSAFQLQTSQANPEKIKNAQERLTSCIIGLLVIIFSVFILRLIGVDILKIPGFGK